ncbi:MAG: flagellar type III secretion system pore protein FliP [Syntrophobacterales bacterium]|jgi:flagellar biosynthetic protein FliP|nr:flagellar type III secretion system pore protein FliP [Syntrophobacterales bacterium]
MFRASRRRIAGLLCLVLISGVILAVGDAGAESFPVPSVSLQISNTAKGADQTAVVLQLLLLLTVLSLAPAILIMLTSFTRIVVVLSLLRHALGTQGMPPNQVIIGLSLFLTFFIMGPVWNQVNTQAVQPYFSKQISTEKAIEMATPPLRDFMLKQTREKDIALFIKVSNSKRPEKPSDVGMSVLVPAFVISELRTAFQIGFLIYLPFLVLDMVVASVLLSMGMLMLPPIMVSLPFKLLLFVMVDGWYLIVGSLVQSFGQL